MEKNVTSYELSIDGIRIIWHCPCCGKRIEYKPIIDK